MKWPSGVSGDKVPRRLVMLVDDYLFSVEAMDPRQWLRQSSDLTTLLMNLRSTILTRITGAAGCKQAPALVPVGAVSVEDPDAAHPHASDEDGPTLTSEAPSSEDE